MSTPIDLNAVLDALVAEIATRVAAQLAAMPPAAPVAAAAPEWLDTKAAAALIGVSPITLELYRNKRTGPPFHKPSRSVVRYRRSELDAWLAGDKGKRK